MYSWSASLGSVKNQAVKVKTVLFETILVDVTVPVTTTRFTPANCLSDAIQVTSSIVELNVIN